MREVHSLECDGLAEGFTVMAGGSTTLVFKAPPRVLVPERFVLPENVRDLLLIVDMQYELASPVRSPRLPKDAVLACEVGTRVKDHERRFHLPGMPGRYSAHMFGEAYPLDALPTYPALQPADCIHVKIENWSGQHVRFTMNVVCRVP